MNLEQTVARHYAHGSLEQAILEALAAAGKDVNRLSPADLAPVDEFHVGGRPAPLGLHIVMGDNAAQKVANMMNDIERGLVAPIEMVCRAV